MQADLRLCWSHIPHCWKSHAMAQISTVKYVFCERNSSHSFSSIVLFYNLWTSSFFAISDTMRSFLWAQLLNLIPIFWGLCRCFCTCSDGVNVVWALSSKHFLSCFVQWLARILKLLLSYYNFQRGNINDADQTEQMRRLVCCLHATKPAFLALRPIFYIHVWSRRLTF